MRCAGLAPAQAPAGLALRALQSTGNYKSFELKAAHCRKETVGAGLMSVCGVVENDGLPFLFPATETLARLNQLPN